MTTSTDHEPHDDEKTRRIAIARTADTHQGKVFAPSSTPVAVVGGVVIAFVLLALVIVAIRDLVVQAGWVSGTRWSREGADWVARSTWQQWMWPVAIALILIGLWLLWSAVRTRRRTHVSLGGYEVMWTRRGDIARRISTAALSVPGVEHATTVVGRRRAKVVVTATDTHPDADAIRAAVASAAAAPEKPLRVKVKIVARRRAGESQRAGESHRTGESNREGEDS
ncbi:DUF6286 domain-containing protein [Gordonia sp. NPDC003429]